MKTIRLTLSATAASPVADHTSYAQGDRIASNWAETTEPGEWWLATVKEVKTGRGGKKSYTIVYDAGGDESVYTDAYMRGENIIKVEKATKKSKKSFKLSDVQAMVPGAAAAPEVEKAEPNQQHIDAAYTAFARQGPCKVFKLDAELKVKARVSHDSWASGAPNMRSFKPLDSESVTLPKGTRVICFDADPSTMYGLVNADDWTWAKFNTQSRAKLTEIQSYGGSNLELRSTAEE